MRAVLGGSPKEMLPVGGRPMIRHAVDEAEGSGIERICIVLRRGKEAIREHLEADLPRSARVFFVWQKEARGVGDALLTARDVVGDEPFAMILPDQLLLSREPATRQLMNRWKPGCAVWSSLVSLATADLPFFPGARRPVVLSREGDVLLLSGFLSPDDAAVETGVRAFGRTIFPPEAFDYLDDEFRDPASGEIDLGQTITALETKARHYGVVLEGQVIDCGTPEGWHRWSQRA